MGRKKWLLIGVQALVISTLIGCSQNNSGTPSSSPPASSPPASSPAAPSTSAQTEPAETPIASQSPEQPPSEEVINQSTEQSIFADHAAVTIPEITDGLQMDQKSYDFIIANYQLFPAKTSEEIAAAKKLTDASITSKHLNKNAAPYFDKMVSYSGIVISIEETQIDGGQTIAIAHVLDENAQSYEVMIYKETGDILEEDEVQFWGVPIGVTGFENVSGGYTNAIFVLGAHIEKI